MNPWQHTIAEPAILAGVGLHSGKHVRMALRPADPDSGVVFVRNDLAGDNRIRAEAANVADLRLGTTLRNNAGAEVATVEHLMAALAGLGVDNIIVELDGPELPAADGSAAPFAALLRRAGLRRQGAPRGTLRVLREVSVELDGKRATLSPADGRILDISIEFAAPIGRQAIVFDAAEHDFEAELAGARTFGFMADADRLRASQRGLGASFDNTVLIADGAVANPEGLRFADEFVRHKALDALGDLALAGAPILGRYRAERPGHALNLALVRALMANRSAWRREAQQVGSQPAAAPGVG
jgi:UDP-3-O-[3-hydroxymyristoyl] N-acetylglucosamine deacetylase